jgi:hypothetical protein
MTAACRCCGELLLIEQHHHQQECRYRQADKENVHRLLFHGVPSLHGLARRLMRNRTGRTTSDAAGSHMKWDWDRKRIAMWGYLPRPSLPRHNHEHEVLLFASTITSAEHYR